MPPSACDRGPDHHMSWLREPDAEPIPGYRLIEPLGSGGFGEVWKCTAPGGLLKAIKFVYGSLKSEDVDAVRAEQERKALERVKRATHPFVLSLERIEESADGELMIVMELAEKSLHDLFVEFQEAGQTGIPRADLLRYLEDAAQGLDFLNDRHNLQHLDVKPRNLFLISDRVKVADFGLVKSLEGRSSSGMMGGVTPIYAAPETFRGKISKQSDQYSLAVVYMELLTGKRPFHGKNIRQIALQHMTEPPDLAPLAPGDRAAVARALAKEPGKRFPSCMAFVRALAPGPSAVVVTDLEDESDLGPAGYPGAGGPATPQPDDVPATSLLARQARAAVGTQPVLELQVQAKPAVRSSHELRPTRPDLDVRARSTPRPEGGVLRPTLFLGVGSFGWHALLELRCRLLDRFGDLGQLPAFRFLYLDSDPDALREATAGTSEVTLSPAEVFPLPLQPVAKYRRRMLDHLESWLPREKLYSIPRSLKPGNVRALGRLAFCDNYLHFQARLRRELAAATHTDTLVQTAAVTKLPASDNCPRVYVLASAVEGVSGGLTDLGYTLRRLLDQLNFPHAPTAAVVYCGSPLDPATPAQEQANFYATLTELNHFQDPNVSFLAQYGPEGPQVADHRSPFDSVYLTLRRDRTPLGLRESIAHLATYLTHDLASPLGAELEQRRGTAPGPQALPFRSFGTSTAWYPRGLLLRVAARKACERLMGVWRSTEHVPPTPEVEQVCAEAFADPGLTTEALVAALNDAAAQPGEGTPSEVTERYLAALEVQAAGVEVAGAWSAQALERVREWAGTGAARDPDTNWQKSIFFRHLQLAALRLAEEWDRRLTGQVLRVMQLPGYRLAHGETALARLIQYCDQAVALQLQQVERHFESLRPVRDGLAAAQAQCQAGGFKLFGGGPQRALRYFLAQVGQFARLRVAQDMLEAALIFFRSLRSRLEDRIKDIGFSRQRLKALEQLLAAPVGDWAGPQAFTGENGDAAPGLLRDPFWEAVQGTATVEIVLPGGESDLEKSAGQFIDSLRPEHWQQLDEELHAKVLAPLGNLLSACTGNANLLRHLGRPLVEQTAAYLGGILPITDVAQVEYSAAKARGKDLGEGIRKTHQGAVPVLGGQDEKAQAAYLLVPDSEAGRSLGFEAQRAIPGLTVVKSNALTELTVCREQDSLGVAELQQLLNLSRLAYQEMAPQPPTSPHARFDVIEWLPLEP